MTREEKWLEKYKLLEEYYNKNGNLDIPYKYEVDGLNLYQFIIAQRQIVKRNRHSRSTKRHIELLNKIGMIWDYPEYIWNKHYILASEYYEQHHHLNIPLNYEIDNVKLGAWISEQRKAMLNTGTSVMTPLRIKKLNEIGMIWSLHDESWNEMYILASNYYKKYNNLDILTNYEINGKKLGSWIQKQRTDYNNNILVPERIEKLENIGMIWKKSERYDWDIYYSECIKFYKKYNHLNVPRSYKSNNLNIGTWLNNQITKHNKGVLEEEKNLKLESLNIDWNCRKNKILNTQIDDLTKKKIEKQLLIKLKNILKYYEDDLYITNEVQMNVENKLKKKLNM